MPMPPSTGRPDAGDEAGRVGAQEHHGVGHVGDLAEAPGGVCSMTAPTAASGAREQAGRDHVAGELHAHLGRHQAGVDAVDAHAVAELAGLHGGDAGQPVDGRLGGRVAGDRRERDGRRDRGDVDHRAAVAGRTARAHGAERVLDAERRAEMLTSSIRRRSAGSRSTTSAVISMPALLIRMSKPPSSATVAGPRPPSSSSSVTSSVDEAGLRAGRDSLPRCRRPSVVEHVADHHARRPPRPAPRPCPRRVRVRRRSPAPCGRSGRTSLMVSPSRLRCGSPSL